MKQLLVFLALILPIFADDSKPTTSVSDKRSMEFSAEGVVRIVYSFGELTIEGWDQPAVELTKTRFSFAGREMKPGDASAGILTMAREGNAVVITLGREHHGIFHPTPDGDDVDREYSIKVPRAARLDIDHDHGEVNITGVTGDIRAVSRYGPILLRLPAEGHYAIDADCRFGTVYSDFAGDAHRRHLFGESFASRSEARQKLDLKVGMGDIMILKMNGR
ncbi:MAG TPA: hypothetical protein VK419_06575 [Bryobacteraceae bacterium]|nr:hypothetical protein [Bryobacteraceae bacterium]